MGYRYFLTFATHKVEFAYSVNGNLFWKMALEEMIRMVTGHGVITGEDGTKFTMEEFMFVGMNGKRHVSSSEYEKYRKQCGAYVFPVYNPHTDDKIYKFVEENK